MYLSEVCARLTEVQVRLQGHFNVLRGICHPLPTLLSSCMHAPRAADSALNAQSYANSRAQQARAQNAVLPAAVLLMQRGGGHMPHCKPAGRQQRLKAGLAPSCTTNPDLGYTSTTVRPGASCQQHPLLNTSAVLHCVARYAYRL